MDFHPFESTYLWCGPLPTSYDQFPIHLHPWSSLPTPYGYYRQFSSVQQQFQSLAEVTIIMLHLEVRCHCFYYLLPAIQKVSKQPICLVSGLVSLTSN